MTGVQTCALPISELDLTLYKLQIEWWETFVKSRDKLRTKQYPLIAEAGVGIILAYAQDMIRADAIITNINGFLSLNKMDRKKLLNKILEQLRSRLFLNTDLLTGDSVIRRRSLYKKHIQLTLAFGDIYQNTKGKDITLILPSDMGVGQAAYKDGEFVYSEPYYLNLQIKDGKAIAGDASKFVIEKE